MRASSLPAGAERSRLRSSLLAAVLASLVACADDAVEGDGGGGGGELTGTGGTTGATASVGATTGAEATTTSASGSGGGGGPSSGSGGGGGTEAFVLEVSTVLSEGALTLLTNLPEDVPACLAVEAGGAPCEDVDDDGLVDAWEDVVLDRLRPLVVFDEDESLVDDASFGLGLVGRVAPTGDRLLVTMMLGYARDFGSCGGFTSHNGDSERVALSLSAASGDPRGDASVIAAYTAAHEGTASDHGRVFAGAELALLTHVEDEATGEPRWAVFSSADKHATYGSISICEDISVIPCFDEDCGPDGVDPAAYQRLFPFVNAGEESAPRVSDLGPLGFPGEDAWADQDFCGGLGGSGCSSPVREKLLADPF